MRGIVIGIISMAALTAANADNDGSNVFYVGGGQTYNSSSGTAKTSEDTPFSIGMLHASKTANGVFGFDIGREGTMLDSTAGRTNAVKSGTSLNLLFGTNLGKPGVNSRIDAALLLGGRQTTKSCPASYLGYQCYADQDPSTSYGVNYGAVLTWAYSSMVLGLRVTGESAQFLFGGSF